MCVVLSELALVAIIAWARAVAASFRAAVAWCRTIMALCCTAEVCGIGGCIGLFAANATSGRDRENSAIAPSEVSFVILASSQPVIGCMVVTTLPHAGDDMPACGIALFLPL